MADFGRWLLFLLHLVLAVSGQNPFIDESGGCALKKCKAATKLRETEGDAVRYRYTAGTASTMAGVTTKNTSLSLQCDVIVHTVSECERAITLENLQLHTVAVVEGAEVEHEVQDDHFTSVLLEHPIRYSFYDGLVEDVCSSEGDPTWSINIKKGIISALQNTMERLDLDHEDMERDITGDCPTTYRVQKVSSDGLQIVKVRDLNSCSNRFSHTSHIQGVGYNIKAPVQNLPIINSRSSCHQVVRGNRIVRVSCEERHLLQPFSNNGSGAVTTTSQNLVFSGEESSSYYKGSVKHRSNLLYNHLPAKSAFQSRGKSLGDAEELVEDLCKDDSEVRLDTTSQFSRLIYDLRGMSHAQISSLYRLSPKICRHGQKFIEDALPVVSTSASMILMRDLIVGEEVTTQVANAWLLALNFIPSVDLAMLQLAGDLLTQRRPEVTVRVHLAVGAVLRQYCQQHERCQTESAVMDIVNKLAKKLGSNCEGASETQEKLILLSLRALGNAGLSTYNLVMTLNECFLVRSNPARIKVAAIETFRRFSCEVGRDEMRSLFTDISEDSEVRIAAYLGLMRCPSFKGIEQIYESLSQEPINQVGSFIWTHLTNLQETASPYQMEVQGVLADLHLQRKFSADVRKFSRNMEVSGFNSQLHLGTSLDSNLVYSSRSYIPRSLSSNLTFQMFGESINLLEVGMRTEGIEKFVESVFAPGGILHGMGPQSADERSRRQIPDQTKYDQIKEKFDAAGQFGKPMAAFHMKVFGHEIDYLDLRGQDIQQLIAEFGKNGPAQWLARLARTETVDYSRTLNFLEGTYIVPTALGLPLNMTTTAVAAINVQMSGNAKLDQLWSNQKLDLAFHLKPSGAITFDGSMIVDGFAVQLGLDMRATLHTSTLVDASLKMQGYRMVEAKFNMPKDRMDIYNFESTLRFTHQESRTLHQSEISIEDDDHARIEFNSCTGGHLYKGWHTCAHLMYINASSNSQSPYFPLTGPAKIGLYVEKTDKPMQGYLLKWELIDTQFDHIFSVEFDTPLSDVNRAISLKLRRKKANGMLGFRLSVTGDAYAGKGVSWWDSSKKGVQLTVQREGVSMVDLTAVLEKTSDTQSTVYQPTFMVVLLGNLYVSLKGTIKRADAGNARKRLVDLSLKSPFINLELTSEATQSRPLYKSKIIIKHSLGSTSPDRQLLLVLESRQEVDGYGGIVGHWMVVADLDFSDKTKIVRAIRWDSKSSPVGSLFLFQTALRPDDFGENSIFSLGYSTNFVSGEESRKVNGSVEFRYPSMGLDLRLAVEHENIYQGLRNKITLRYAPGGEIRSELNVTGLPLLLTGRVEAHWLVYLSQQTSPIALHGLVRLIPRMNPAVTQACQFRFSGTWFDGMTAVTAGEYRLKEDYEAASMEHNATFSVDVASQRLMEGNAAVILTQSGIKSQLQVDYRSSEYALNADYYVAAGNYHTERSLQTSVTYPDGVYSVYGSLGLGDRLQCSFGAHLDRFRDIQLEIHGDRNDTWTSGGVDVKWDANRDPTRRLAFNFALDRQLGGGSTHNLTASFIYPVNTVRFTMERSLSGDWQSLSYTNKLLLDYGDSDPLTLDMELMTDLNAETKSIAVDAVAKSPYQDWRVNSINMRYKRSPFDLDSRLEVSAAGEEVTFTVGGVTKFPVEVDLAVNLTSTLTRWNDLTGRVRHHLQPGQSSVSAIHLMTSNHRIATGLRLEDLTTASERKYQADLNFTSSFQGFHEAGVLVEGLYRPGELQVTAATRLENQGHDVIVSVNKSADQRIRGLVTLHQRHPNVNKLKLEVAVDPTENGRSFKSELLWPNNRAALEGDFHIASPQNFGLGLQFISPFEALKDAGLMLKHKRDGRVFDSEFRVAWILSSPLALKLNGNLKSILQFEMSTELQLPLDKWNRYSLDVKNNLQLEEKKILSSIETLVDSYKTSIQLDGSLGATAREKKFSTLTVVLPLGPVSTVAITGSVLNYKPGVYEVYLAPSWQLTDGSLEQIRATGMVEVGHAGNGGQVQGTLRLLTPWYPLLYVEMLHTPTDNFGSISRMEGSLGARRFLLKSQLKQIADLGGYRLSVNTSSNLAWVPTMDLEATVAAKPHYSTVLTVWTPKQYRLTFGGDIHSLERKYLTAELQTPLAWLDKSSVRLELTGEDGNYHVIGDVDMPDDGQSIKLEGTINPQELHFTLDTPFESFSQAEFRISTGYSPGLYSPVLLLTWNKYKLELTGTADTDGSSWPNKLSGSLVMHLPVGPAVDGTLQIETTQGEELVYKVILSTTGDQQRYDLEVELHAGPLRYGIVYQLDSDERILVGSGSLLLEMNAQDTGRTALLVQMVTQHPLIRNVTLNVYYTLEENGGRIGGWKLRHPMLSIEGSGRVSLPSWMQFDISGKFLLTTKHLTLNKAIRLYHSPTELPGSGELGVGWNLGGRLGKYHCLVKHTVAADRLDFSLLAGPDVWENRTAPTDLNVGVDVDGHVSMARAVINVEVARLKYTLDVDYSIQLPYRGSVRSVRRGLDSEWEITAAASLQPESGQLLPSGFYSYEPAAGDRWIGTANLSLLGGAFSAEYERILSRFTVLPAYPTVEFSGQAEIQPRSSFYEQSSHSLELKTDFSQLPEMSGSVVYEKTGRSSDDVTRTTGTLTTTYNSDEIGALLHGEMAGGAYSGHLQKISTDSTGSAMINITTSLTTLRQFVAEYSAEGGSYPSQTTFTCFHNERSLIQGVYTRDLLDSGAHYHSIIVQNPLHPFSANATYNVAESQRTVEVGVSSLLNASLTAKLTARLQTAASSRDLDATLRLPEHVVLFNHAIAMHSGSYVRSARLELSPQLFVGYQLHYNTSDEQDRQERALCLRLDLPPRSLALTASGALTSPRSDVSQSGVKSSLVFQWDLLREPEYQVEAGMEFSDLSTADKLHYNITLLGDILGKPLSLVSSLQHSAAEPVLLDATFRYRPDAASLMTVSYGVLDQSRGAKRDLTSTLYIAHPISKLSITGKGHLEMNAEIVKLAGTYTYLDLQDETLEAEISFNMNRKLGDFEGKILLPSILYEMRWISGASGYRLTGSEIPLDYRSPRTLNVHVEPDRPTFKLDALYDADLNKRLHVSAGVLNSRHWQVHVFRDSGVYHVDDVVLFVRLNHSHLLSSQARWRTEIAQELQTWAVDTARDYRAGLRYAVAKEWRVKTGAMHHDLLQTLAEELQLLSGDFATERDGSILGDYLRMQETVMEAFDEDIFYMQTVWSYIYGNDAAFVNAALNQLSSWIEQMREDLGIINETVYNALNRFIDYVRDLLSSSKSTGQGMTATLEQLAMEIIEAYHQWVRHVYVRVSLQLRQIYATVTGYINHRFMQAIEAYRPQLLMLHHTVETNVVNLAKDVFNWFQGEFTQTELFMSIQWMQKQIDQIYRDIQERDTITNILDYSNKLLKWAYMHFGLDELIGEPWMWLQQKWSHPTTVIAKTKEIISFVYEKLQWMADQVGLWQKIHKLLLRLYEDGDQLWAQTAITSTQRYFEGKGMMEMRPNEGYISYVQLLPMPWYGLNQTPVWRELPEIQKLKSFQSWMKQSEWSIYDLVYYYWPGTNPYDWLPPFKAQAVVSGSSHIVTFDGKLYTIRSDCSYLLAADLLNDRFQIFVRFRSSEDLPKLISISAGGHTVQLGATDVFSIKIDGESAEAPATVGQMSVVRSGDVVSVKLPGLVEVSCNQRADLCSVEISGWLFGRTGGLLGTYDNEQYSDMHSPDHYRVFPALFAASWSLDRCSNSGVKLNELIEGPPQDSDGEQRTDGFCWGLLGDARSEYRICHRLVDPAPYLAACTRSLHQSRCVAIQAYVLACQHRGMPLKVPNKCVRCDIRGQAVIEGKTVVVNNKNPSTEVVFIIEAKECNRNITQPRAIRRLVAALETALIADGFVDVRYAVVAFGGSDSLAEPQALTVKGNVFNRAGKAIEAFDNIHTGDGNEDVFGALRFAALLPFSAGVSRTFILIPCSTCAAEAMSFDYTTLANAFAEQQVTLHVLMHHDFLVEKSQSQLYGIDRDHAWTTRDVNQFQGDAALLKHVKPPKASLHLCGPLARKETKGSVFSASVFRPNQVTGRLFLRPLKRFLTVFSRRVAMSARPRPCEECECITAVDGTARPVCYPCSGLLPLDPEDDIFLERDY